MRRTCSFAVLLLFFLVLSSFTGCGREEESLLYDIEVEKKAFYDVAGANGDVYTSFRNMQFFKDELVQIWTVYDGVSDMDAYLYRMDGSRTLLLKNMPMEYDRGGGFVDGDGNYYYWAVNQGGIVKVDPSGEQLFSRQLSDFGIFQIVKLCQSGDGSLYAQCVENIEGSLKRRLCRLDPSTGEITRIENGASAMELTTYMAAWENGLFYMTEKGIQKIDAEKGVQEEAWSFAGTSYSGGYNADFPVWDFRIREDGSLELLEAGNTVHEKGADGISKTLRKIVIGEDREVVTLRGTWLVNDKWLKQCVRSFNEQNKDWYVMLEECEDADTSWEDYGRQTSIEIASGKGPDILYGDVLADYAYGVFRKGGFADLSPYLEVSGMKKEDFFPCVFGCWQDGEGIYGVSLKVSFWDSMCGGLLLDAAVVGGNGEPDIKELVDALLAWEEDAIFRKYADSQEVLERFLAGTEDLWGMVDWEEGTCDFGTELFAGMLEVAKRYGMSDLDDARPPLTEREDYDAYMYLDEDLLNERGKVRLGALFNDGSHAIVAYDRVMMVNANSDRKEGAWEFIRFLLEDKQISQLESLRYPASKNAFDIVMASEKAKGLWKTNNVTYDKWEDKTIYHYPLTDERIVRLKEILEDARFAPFHTQPILNIIYEEASGYFGGVKNIEDTIDVINNRVQNYLDEDPA